MYKAPKWTGLKMQAYTRDSKTGGRQVELLMDMVLSHIRSADTKMKFVTLWAGKEARTYLSTLEQDNWDSLRTILDSLEEWTRPKSDEIAAFTHTSEH